MDKYCVFSGSLCPKKFDFPETNQVFLAYSSHDNKVLNEIKNARANLNKETSINWISWEEDLDIENEIIFCEICKNIVSAKAVVAELSDLNFNVIFEYGYSIGLAKKIFPTVNENFSFGDIERFIRPLIGIGISKYENNQLSKKILKKRFWEKSTDNKIFSFTESDILNDKTSILFNNIFYIKNSDNQEVTEKIENEIEKFALDLIVDDPLEDNYNLSWYSKQIKKSYAVIIDLGNSSKSKNFKHYAKCALIAGICSSTGRRMLFLNNSDTTKPSDIITIVKSYDKGKDAAKHVYGFLNHISNDIAAISSYIRTINQNKISIFDNMDIGEHVAANDTLYLDNCFVQSSEYNKMLRNGYKIILGRKGTGKSASFFRLKNERNGSNIINISQYFDKYNLNDLYELVSLFDSDNARNKIASAYWHYVIFSIIANKIYQLIDSPSYFNQDNDTEEFKSYIASNPLVLETNIITDSLVEIIHGIMEKGTKDIKEIKTKFFADHVIELKRQVINYLHKTNKLLCMNFDGLDSNISISIDNKLTSLILFNLHETCSDIFSGKIENFSINLFLRKDLYDTFKTKISEKDKINKVYLLWSSDQLLQMVNLRLQKNNIDHIADILSDDLKIHQLNKKIEKYVYLRPRDYIIFFNSLIHSAQSLKRDSISNKSLTDAVDDYAIHINESLDAEFLSIKEIINLSNFLSKVKEINNNEDKIPITYLFKIFSSLGVDRLQYENLLDFLLGIEFIYILENNEKVSWRNILNPSIK